MLSVKCLSKLVETASPLQVMVKTLWDRYLSSIYTHGPIDENQLNTSVLQDRYHGKPHYKSVSCCTHLRILTIDDINNPLKTTLHVIQGGDSGAPILHAETGKAIGIHTNGGCNKNDGTDNFGVRIDVPALKQAISDMIDTFSPTEQPTSANPMATPTTQPTTGQPTTKKPTSKPTSPTSANPTATPTAQPPMATPTATPTKAPTNKPIASTSTKAPTNKPIASKSTKKPVQAKSTKVPKQPEAKATKAPEAKAAKKNV
jgi:hypothetical protein